MDGTTSDVREVIEQRIALEKRLQNERGELPADAWAACDGEYERLQRAIARLFRDAATETDRVTLMLEMMRILENRLVYLQNFSADPGGESRLFAQLVRQFLDGLSRGKSGVLTPLESTYYRAVADLCAGDAAAAREGFAAACASEESDEANDIKFKSYVILGNLSHEERDYARAKDLHGEALRYSANENVTAQALALKALNSYALQQFDEARRLFEEAIRLFDPSRPFFNSYFFRNALLFCGAICYDRGDYERAEMHYRRAAETAERNSYDRFDALSHLGRIHYAGGRFDEAVGAFEEALASMRPGDSEPVVDTWFWIARSHMKRNDPSSARPYLEKVVASEIGYGRKPQAREMLAAVS